MSQVFRPSVTSLPVATAFTYFKRSQTDAGKKATGFVRCLKQDSVIQIGGVRRTMSDAMCSTVHDLSKIEPRIQRFCSAEAVLVPMPSSSLRVPGGLWVPERICKVLTSRGIGREVSPLVERIKPVPKSATSNPADRPTVEMHYESMGIDVPMIWPRKILLIDDVVTKGATFLAAASRIRDVAPSTTEILAFALVSTAAKEEDFTAFVQPFIGTIWYGKYGAFRKPEI